MRCSSSFGTGNCSPGLEMASYVVKAIFDPDTQLPAVNHAEEAFIETMISYTRQPR